MEKQREKQRGGITGKGFIAGDPRINRTKPGPGRPPLWWKQALGRYETASIATIAHLMRRDKNSSVRLRAAQYVLDRLHGKPKQSVEVVPPVDLSHLSDKELKDLGRLLDRVGVAPFDGAGVAGRNR